MRKLLLAYLNGENFYDVINGEVTDAAHFGINIYDGLLEWLNSERFEEYYTLGFYALWQHKTCMFDRLKFMSEQGFDIPESILAIFVEIERRSRTLHSVALKGRLTQSTNTRVNGYIEELRDIERDALNKLLRHI